ncbi:MAG: LamG-like jellyroll fold domain-containing protein, partial [Saprospiraceae bacterium]
YTRNLKFTLYARDNQPGAGGTALKEVSFEVDGTAGPFLVTSQNSCAILTAGASQTITWDVANTSNTNVNAQTVNIELSIDGGYTWGYSLAINTANDGSESITLPANICTDRARIKVEVVGSGYSFFDVNDQNFSIYDAANNLKTPLVINADGVNDGVEINETVGNFGTGDFTIEFNMKSETSGTGGFLVAKRAACSAGNFWQIWFDRSNGTIKTTYSDGTNPDIEINSSNNDLRDGMWHHIAITRASGTVKIYIDGTEKGSGTAAINLTNSDKLTLVTHPCEFFYATYDGSLTEVRIWNAARTESEITNNANCPLTGMESNLALYYPLYVANCGSCGANGNGITDASGNDNHGTLLNDVNIEFGDNDLPQCSGCTHGAFSINSQPGNTTVAAGSNASFSIGATGTGLVYQWLASTDNGATFQQIAGATESTYTTTVNGSDNGNQYICRIANDCDIQTSSAATLTVNCNSLSISNITGEAAPCEDGYFTYYADPNSDVVSWNWSAPAGWEVTAFENMVFAQVGSTVGQISVTATDGCGGTDTKNFSVNPVLIEITTNPTSQTVNEGTSVSLTTAVTNGSGTTDYLWQESFDGGATFIDIENSNAAAYSFTADLEHDDRQYRCVVDSDCLRDTTDTAVLTVNCTTTAPLNNQSIVGAAVICNNNATTYALPAIPGADTYTWTLPNGWTGNSTNNEISVIPNGSGGTVSVSVTNGCGTSAASTLEVSYDASNCHRV